MLAFLPQVPSNYQMIAGQSAYTFSALNASNVTVTYGYTFTSIIAVLLSVQTAANNDIVSALNGAPGVTTAAVRLAQKDAIAISTTGFVHWLVIGTT